MHEKKQCSAAASVFIDNLHQGNRLLFDDTAIAWTEAGVKQIDEKNMHLTWNGNESSGDAPVHGL